MIDWRYLPGWKMRTACKKTNDFLIDLLSEVEECNIALA